MARRDLTNAEVERMGRDEPGSAAEYLRLRREELQAEREAELEADDKRLFVEQYVVAGGDPGDAGKEYKRFKAEKAAESARRSDTAAVVQVRRHVSGRL
jgi:hypothetical protein